jgi:hypothetical protein
VTDRIKAVSGDRGITNSLLVAGIANHETNLSHCVADYYTRQCEQTPGTPSSQSCGGDSVLVGNSDPSCDEGGLGLFQIDKGTQEQTIATVGTKVLELDGNIDLGITNIIEAVWHCQDTPAFGNDAATAYPQVITWMNGARQGTTDYDTYMGCIAQLYNGCGKGCTLSTCNCDYNERKGQYRNDTDALVSEFGDAYWNGGGATGGGGTGGSCQPGGIICGSSPALAAGRYDANTLYQCNEAGTEFLVKENCFEGCAIFSDGEPDECVRKSLHWPCADSLGTDGLQHWTCNNATTGHADGDGSVYKCDDQGQAIYVECTRGCTNGGLNADDYCA